MVTLLVEVREAVAIAQQRGSASLSKMQMRDFETRYDRLTE